MKRPGRTDEPMKQMKAGHKMPQTACTPDVVSTADSEFAAILMSQYDPLRDIGDIATVLRRTEKSIRTARSCDGAAGWTGVLRQARVRQGRRVLFRTRDIAAIIEHGPPAAKPKAGNRKEANNE